MSLRLNLAIAIVPALALLWWFRRQDAKRPEPHGLVTKVVFFGVLATAPAIVLELLLGHELGGHLTALQGGFVKAFVVAALVEESLKLAVVLRFVWRSPRFDEVMDGILYTAAASLGFAVLENVLYSFSNPVVGVVRAFTAVPMHAVGSGVMGYFVGRAKMSRGAAAPWVLTGLAAGVLLHGCYDWSVMSDGTFGLAPKSALGGIGVACLVLIAATLVLRRMIRHALSIDDAAEAAAAHLVAADS